jgi:hypothetical protein
MRNSPAPPVITVTHDVYAKILQADGVIVVAEDSAARPIAAGALPDFFSVRRCLLTTGPDAGPPWTGMMRDMVGG